MDPSGGGGCGGGGGTSHLSLSWTVVPHTSDGMIWRPAGISNRLTVSISVLLLLHFSPGDSALLDERKADLVGECTDPHISAAVENIQVCKPRPVIVALPLPNNTNVQQVKVAAVKHPE